MKISIITPSFNCVKYIERAIQSVLNQDYENWEHIIIDGGSTDGTVDILKKYDHLKWISEPDRGQSDAMNKGFAISTGDVVGYLNADDEYAPGVFKLMAEQFNTEKKTEFVFGDLIQTRDGHEYRNKPNGNLNAILNYWPCQFPLNAVSYFYKREVQATIGHFPVDNHFTMDYWFLLRVFKNYKTKYIPIVFGNFHFTDTNKSGHAERARESLRVVRNQFLRDNPFSALLYFLSILKSRLGYMYFVTKKKITQGLNPAVR